MRRLVIVYHITWEKHSIFAVFCHISCIFPHKIRESMHIAKEICILYDTRPLIATLPGDIRNKTCMSEST